MHPVGFWTRLMAHNIDLIVMLPVYYLMSFFIDSNQILIWLCLVVTYLYEVIAIASSWGGTLGKKMMKTKVTNDDLTPVSLWKSSLRAFVKAFSVLTLFIGYLTIVLHPQKKSLHDLVMKTSVIFSPTD